MVMCTEPGRTLGGRLREGHGAVHAQRRAEHCPEGRDEVVRGAQRRERYAWNARARRGDSCGRQPKLHVLW
jgi:hypothetical protein